MQSLQDAIIKSGKPEEIHEFVYNSPDADIKVLESAMLKTKDPRGCYNFALEIWGG